MSDNQDLINRCTKMSFLLGLAMGALSDVMRDTTIANFQKEYISHALQDLYKGIDELYYKEEPK